MEKRDLQEFGAFGEENSIFYSFRSKFGLLDLKVISSVEILTSTYIFIALLGFEQGLLRRLLGLKGNEVTDILLYPSLNSYFGIVEHLHVETLQYFYTQTARN